MFLPDHFGDNPTLSQVALAFREQFRSSKKNKSPWLCYVSPLDVAVAARQRGQKPKDGRIAKAVLGDVFFQLVENSKSAPNA